MEFNRFENSTSIFNQMSDKKSSSALATSTIVMPSDQMSLLTP